MNITAITSYDHRPRLFPWIRVLLAAVCLGGGCRQRGVTVEYVVPDGYRGAVMLAVSEAGPEHVVRSNDGLTVRIPTSGMCFTRTELPSQRPHFLRARYANGDVLPIAGATNIPDNVVGFRRIAAAANDPDTEWIVIGTKDDVRAALRNLDGF